MTKLIFCARCEEYIGMNGLDTCPICGGNLVEGAIIVDDEEKEEEDE